MKEKEKQRALEAEQRKVAELRAKKDAEEALLRRWKDTGFAVSQLPPCPLNVFTNCFGSGTDAKGNEYVGEFMNRAPVGKVIINYKNGDRYVGEYDKVRNGEGIYYFLKDDKSKGIIFVGQYRDDIQRGDGIYFDRNGGVIEAGLYEDTLIEYRYVDPATFTRIPAGKIPVISSDTRLKIESKQAQIAKIAKEAEEKAVKDRLAALEIEKQRESQKLSQCESHKVSSNAIRSSLAITGYDYSYVCHDMFKKEEYTKLNFSTEFKGGKCYLNVFISGMIRGSIKSCRVSRQVSEIKDNMIIDTAICSMSDQHCIQ